MMQPVVAKEEPVEIQGRGLGQDHHQGQDQGRGRQNLTSQDHPRQNLQGTTWAIMIITPFVRAGQEISNSNLEFGPKYKFGVHWSTFCHIPIVANNNSSQSKKCLTYETLRRDVLMPIISGEISP